MRDEGNVCRWQLADQTGSHGATESAGVARATKPGERGTASTVGFGADFAQEAEEFVVDVKVGSSQLLFA